MGNSSDYNCCDFCGQVDWSSYTYCVDNELTICDQCYAENEHAFDVDGEDDHFLTLKEDYEWKYEPRVAGVRRKPAVQK